MDARTSIITAFQSLVSGSSYAATSIRGICHEAHVSTRTFYRYFPDKHALLEAIIEQDFIEPARTAHSLFNTAQNSDIGNVLFAQIHQSIKRNKEFYSKIFSLKTPELMEPYVALVTQYNEMSFQNSIEDDTSRHFGAYMVAAANAIVIAKWLEGGCQTSPERLQKLCQEWLYGPVYTRTNTKGAGA